MIVSASTKSSKAREPHNEHRQRPSAKGGKQVRHEDDQGVKQTVGHVVCPHGTVNWNSFTARPQNESITEQSRNRNARETNTEVRAQRLTYGRGTLNPGRSEKVAGFV